MTDLRGGAQAIATTARLLLSLENTHWYLVKVGRSDKTTYQTLRFFSVVERRFLLLAVTLVAAVALSR